MTGYQNVRRSAAALGAGALALSALAMTAGEAAAAPETQWTKNDTRFTMQVGDATPKAGDTITVSTSIQRRWSVEFVYDVKHLVPGCLRYVEGSASWQGVAAPSKDVTVRESPGAGEPASVTLDAPDVVSWTVPGVGAGWGASRVVSMRFTVTAACATGEALPTGLQYNGSLVKSAFPAAGPSITVVATGGGDDGGGDDGDGGSDGGGSTGGDGDGNGDGNGNGDGPDAGVGSVDLGSLGGLF